MTENHKTQTAQKNQTKHNLFKSQTIPRLAFCLPDWNDPVVRAGVLCFGVFVWILGLCFVLSYRSISYRHF